MKNIIKKVKKSLVMILTNNGKGTGFLIDKKGTIFTCAHNIINQQTGGLAENIRITHKNIIYHILPKNVLAIDQNYDYAIIKIENSKEDFYFLEIDDGFDKIEDGEKVLFFGYPLNIDYVITHQGIVSSKQTTDINRTRELNAYQIDRQVINGFSGGPLCLEESGTVIGILAAEVPNQRQVTIQNTTLLIPYSVSMGHAISIEYANKKLKEITSNEQER